MRRRWSATLKRLPAAEVLACACQVEQAAGQGGKWVAYELIRFHSPAFAAVAQGEIADFAARAASWYAVDALGVILAGPLWAQQRLSDALVNGWARSPDRWLRRLALVSTVMLNRKAPGDAARTLPLCRRLAADRDDMVEKAMSWALRELCKTNRAAVVAFLAETDGQLAARVKREVRHKLATGLKSPRRSGR